MSGIEPAGGAGGDKAAVRDLTRLLAEQRAAFQASAPLEAATRIARLDALLTAVLAHENDLVRAIGQDFGNLDTQLLNPRSESVHLFLNVHHTGHKPCSDLS